MKHIISPFLRTILICSLFTACEKKVDPIASYFRAKIDGVPFEATTLIYANKPEPIPGVGSDPTLRIRGGSSGTEIRLVITNEGGSITTGTYDFRADKSRSALLTDNNGTYYAGNSCILCPVVLEGSGVINITRFSKIHVEGDFEFTTGAATSTTGVIKTVTNGEFYIARQ